MQCNLAPSALIEDGGLDGWFVNLIIGLQANVRAMYEFACAIYLNVTCAIPEFITVLDSKHPVPH